MNQRIASGGAGPLPSAELNDSATGYRSPTASLATQRSQEARQRLVQFYEATFAETAVMARA